MANASLTDALSSLAAQRTTIRKAILKQVRAKLGNRDDFEEWGEDVGSAAAKVRRGYGNELADRRLIALATHLGIK